MYKRPSLRSIRRDSNCSQAEERQYEVPKHSKLFKLSDACNRFLQFARGNLAITLLVYFFVVVLVSLVTDYVITAPPTYFSNKRNFINMYFVKVGWGWTLSFVGLMLLLTSSILCGGDWRCICNNMARLIVATVWWYFSTSVFDHTRKKVGYCSGSFSLSSQLCNENSWSGLDISGHSFLLVYSSLIILEESKIFSLWDSLPKRLPSMKKSKQRNCASSPTDQITESLRLFENRAPLIYLSIILVTILFLLWNFMLLMTLIYFHNTLQKVLGFLFAVLGWIASYKYLFKIGMYYGPILPEKCGFV